MVTANQIEKAKKVMSPTTTKFVFTERSQKRKKPFSQKTVESSKRGEIQEKKI
jgi:hypothetical protein